VASSAPAAQSPAARTDPASVFRREGDVWLVVFEGVNVVPMDRERVLANRTVVVTGDRITAIGAAGRVRVPAGARRIDGRGRYLLPGLADFHVHFAVADDMLLYLANGVTTVLV
jgi:imidazolonepropionase-like amidohydrolase